MNLDQDKMPPIPPFLRCYTINGQMLSRAIAVLETAKEFLDDPEVWNKEERELSPVLDSLKAIQDGHPSGAYICNTCGEKMTREPFRHKAEKVEEVKEIVPIDPDTIPLVGTLKDRIGKQIVSAIDDGNNTFNRIRKAIPVLHYKDQDIDMPDRVLKSALNHVMRGKLRTVKIIKSSPKTYEVERFSR